MKKQILLVASLVLCLNAFAQPGRGPRPGADKDAPKEEPKKEAPVNLTFSQGLFSVAQNEKDWYMEIPDSLLGRRFLAITRYVSNTVGAGVYGGEEVNEAMLYWEKAANGNLLLRADVLNIYAAEDQIIDKAVKVSSENPIVASFKPEKNANAGATRIKVNSLFEGDTQVLSLDSRAKRQYNLGGLKGDASFIQSVRTYPINTEVTVTKTYSYNQPQGGPGAGGPGPARSNALPAGLETGAVTVVLNTSMILLPETPMQQRYFDPRVGYFANGYSMFSDEQQGVESVQCPLHHPLASGSPSRGRGEAEEGRAGRARQAHRILH